MQLRIFPEIFECDGFNWVLDCSIRIFDHFCLTECTWLPFRSTKQLVCVSTIKVYLSI